MKMNGVFHVFSLTHFIQPILFLDRNTVPIEDSQRQSTGNALAALVQKRLSWLMADRTRQKTVVFGWTLPIWGSTNTGCPPFNCLTTYCKIILTGMDDSHRGRMTRGYLQTGQTKCYDSTGAEISCRKTGQDGDCREGTEWPEPRFEMRQELVIDHLTGLFWTIDANISEYPLTWQEALDFVTGLNRNHYQGHADWRLPNRKELRSLLSHQTTRPPLPEHHPFLNVFSSWYWTSTSASRNHAFAWYVHMGGGRMFYGRKDESHLLWPVRGKRRSPFLLTGQARCYDIRGKPISCELSGQDGQYSDGFLWPQPRFRRMGDGVTDALTGLVWLYDADLGKEPVNWEEAFDAIRTLNREKGDGVLWRLPNINELETLVDCNASDPALAPGHLFNSVQDAYWSSTTSVFDPAWAWALYLDKGAVGVGQKGGRHFHVWPVGKWERGRPPSHKAE